jgi:pilus assembly protein CpaF
MKLPAEYQSDVPRVTNFGVLQPLMDDASIEEIWINSPNRIFIAKSGISQLTNLVMTSDELKGLIERLLMWGGRRLDLSNPFVDARLPDGSRLHVAIPEVTSIHWAVNIRKHLVRGKSLADLVAMKVTTAEVSFFLTECVELGVNILVSGSTGAGKTTLLNALISAAPIKSRVITIEEVFELKPRLPDCVALQTRSPNLQGEGEIPLRKLIKEALRMRPTRLVVGEIREAESLDLLIALNSGLPGMATIHANSAREAVVKLQTLPLLAGENISHRFITPVVAAAIGLVVHVSMDSAGRRRISEIVSLTGRVEADLIEMETVFVLSPDLPDHEGEYPQYQRGLGRVKDRTRELKR